ncbi:MAG TPA: glycoside hydrolase family 66 protein, partial [Bacteroidales bacterium]|nr:glycoside hydrolase family 66 protein [Bacteroidales bacterium]
MRMLIYFISVILFVTGCKKDNPPVYTPPAITTVNISTDKASYKPGETVTFTIDRVIPPTMKVRYRKLDEKLDEISPEGKSWTWQPPTDDFTGYLVDLYEVVDGKEKIYSSIAVDVSSNWTRFPRYGFLSSYPQLTSDETEQVISNLNRYHINGLQFYDWQYEHHHPLAGTPANPRSEWKDIANRDIYLNTLKQYIEEAHSHNMNAMFYNLAYGALQNAENDGIEASWYMYTDQNHGNRDVFYLPDPPFKSNIYLMDPANTHWQQYIAGANKDVYDVMDFDGYHIDQLGNRNKSLYTYTGEQISLNKTFEPFIERMKNESPDKRLVMNAVNQYAQQEIAASPVDFLYTEVWGPNDEYKDLAQIILDNNALSNGTKQTVLAAYMDYDLANSAGYFNTPGVLLTDAVIFA